MIQNEDTIVVFTARSPERLVGEGGSQGWVLNPARAKQCKWLVCTQNRHNPNHEFFDATEPHGSAFLLGKIGAVVPSEEDDESEHRWKIAISEFARIDRPGVWTGDRNPVRYTSLAELGISLEGLEFQPVPAPTEARTPSGSPSHPGQPGLTIVQAKNGLAATFGVKPEAVEITIRG
jgi:hypothetical protein